VSVGAGAPLARGVGTLRGDESGGGRCRVRQPSARISPASSPPSERTSARPTLTGLGP